MKKRIVSFLLAVLILCTIGPFYSLQVKAVTSGSGSKVIEGGQRNFKWPVPNNYGLSGCFIDNRNPPHHAIDIPATRGTNVVASYGGTVLQAFDSGSGYGKCVLIEHKYTLANGEKIMLYSKYNHLDTYTVKTNDTVKAGDKIGTVGNSGGNYGYHLDFQIMTSPDWGNYNYHNISVDPYVNELLELPSQIYTASTPDCCGVGPTGCCCFYYIEEIKNIYKKPLCKHNYNSVGVCTSTCKKEFDFQSTYSTSDVGLYTVTLSGGIYLRYDKPYAAATSSDKKIKYGTEVEVLGSVTNAFNNKWYKVSYNGEVGYTSADNLKFKKPGDMVITGEITSPGNGEKVPKKSFPVIGTIKSKYPLAMVYGYIDGEKYTQLAAGGVTELELRPTVINYDLDFAALSLGEHVLTIRASDCYHNNPGEDIKVCSVRFTVVSSGTAVCDHSYSGRVTTEPSCESNGIKTYTCSKCGASYTETIPATGDHNYYEISRIDPTCIEYGLATYGCSGCGATYETEIEPIGYHSYEEEYYIPATCTMDGQVFYCCTRCGDDSYYELIPAHGHSMTLNYTEPNCMDYGVAYYTCGICGYSYEETLFDGTTDWVWGNDSSFSDDRVEQRQEYNYRALEYTTDTTPIKPGWQLYDMTSEWSDYGEWSRWWDSPEAEENEYTIVESKEGYSYYYFECPGCHRHYAWAECLYECGGAAMTAYDYHWVYSDISYDDADLFYHDVLGQHTTTKIIDGVAFKGDGKTTIYRYATRTHDTTYYFSRYSDWTGWTSAVLDSDQWDTMIERTCYRYDVGIPNGQHEMYAVYVDATCNTPEQIEYICRRCGYSFVEETYPPLGHDYSEKYVEPTCDTAGYIVYTCQRCGHNYEEIVATPAHKYEAVIVPPTCTSQGYTLHRCKACHRAETYTTDYVPATGHSYEVMTKEPTCVEDGVQMIYCPDCGEIFVETVIPSLEHRYTGSGVCSLCGERDPSYNTEVIKGDVNGDGTINGKDSNVMKQYISGSIQNIAFENADLFEDGQIDAKDANILLGLIAGN